MTALEPLCVLIVAFTSVINGQVDLIQNRRAQTTTLGVFDGQIVQLDEKLAPARELLSQFGHRSGQQGPLSSRRDSAREQNLRNVIGAGQLARSERRNRNLLPARLPARNVLGRPLGSALSLTSASDLQRCPRISCSAQFIPRRCRYTQVQFSPQGDYCLGCPEDICPRESRRPGRRERRIRRLLCLILGICFGEHHLPIPDYPGNDVV